MQPIGISSIKSLIFSKKAVPEPKRSKLGTHVSEPETSNIIEEFSAFPKRAITKASNGYFYSLLANMSPNEIRPMEMAKESVISSLSESYQSSKPSIADAAMLARQRLLQNVPQDKAEVLSYIIAHDTAGYGPISIMLDDKQNIEEIEINSPQSPLIVYSAKYGRCMTNICFSSEFAFRSAINRLIVDTEKELSERTPIIDAQVSDVRVHAQIRPYAVSGAAASIRIGGKKNIDLGYLLSNNTADPLILAYLWLAIECKCNMIISGAPASGKTTFLSCLNAFVPSNDKVITIEEDVNELNSSGISNLVALYGSRYNSITPKEQVVNSLRMRPSRIIIGEMRAEETRDLFMGANMGISFAATMHSNEGGIQILKKLMVKPMNVDPKGIGALDLAMYMKQTDISRRAVSGISEYKWLSRAEIEEGIGIGEEEMVQVSELMKDGKLCKPELKDSKVVLCYSRINGITAKDAIKELERRSKVISNAPAGKSGYVEEAVRKYYGW
jgi:Flp pilus assembly CpaF family ATPase